MADFRKEEDNKEGLDSITYRNKLNQKPIQDISLSFLNSLPDKKLVDSLSRQVLLIRQRQQEIFTEQIKKSEQVLNENKGYSEFSDEFASKEKITQELLDKMREMTGWIDDLHTRANPKR